MPRTRWLGLGARPRGLRPRIRKASLLVFLIAGIAACSGQSCACIQPLKGGFPLAQRRENGVQSRLTQSFLAYVSAHAADIIPALLPMGTTFNIPPSCPGSGNQICCGSPQPTCSLSLTPVGLTLTPAAPDGLHFDAKLIVKTIQNLPVSTSFGSCVISIDTTRTGPIYMTASGDLNLPVDATTRLTGLSLANASVDNIDDGDVNLDESGSDAICALADVGFIKGFIIGQLKTQVGTLVTGVAEGQLCETCMDKSDCSQVATACAGGKCIGPDGMKCVQRLGIEGKADVGTFFTKFSPGTRATIDILEAAGGYVTADTGLSLGVLGGSLADPHAACVPLVAPPAAVEVAASPSFQGDVVPGTATPYDVGIGVHVSHLTTLGYSFWDAGGLCLGITSDKVAQLSAKTLEIIMPSMADLIRTDDAPMKVTIRPQNPPTFTLGKGTFKMVGGSKVVDDPLITLTAKDFTIDFDLFVDDRYVRVATLTADLALPLGLDTDSTGALVLVAGDLGSAFGNLRVTNTELLAETPDELALVFPTVFSAALGPLLSGAGTFHLPTFAGLAIQPTTITSVDPDSSGAGQFLAIYANVKSATTAIRGAHTTASLVSVTTPPTAVFSVRGRDGRRPSVTITAGAEDARPIEFSYAFDGGAWRPFQPAGTHTLTDPGLWLQGRHSLSIRSRVVGDPVTLDPAPLVLSFLVDSEAPTGDFSVVGGRLVPHAADRISPVDALRYRVGSGSFVRAEEVVLPRSVEPGLLRVDVSDEAGNITTLPYRAIAVAAPGIGCSVGAGRAGAGELVIALVLLGSFAARRRSRALLGFCVALLGCHHGAGQGDELDPADPIGRFHDLKSHDGKLLISAYDGKFGDLAYAEVPVAQVDAPITWLLVDGDDPSSPTDGTTPYRHGRTLPGPDVGSYSSLTLTSGGDPRIAYYDATNHALKYANGPFPFSVQRLEAGTSGGVDLGRYPSIAVDLYDKPAIAYMAIGLGDGTNGFRTELHLARAKTSSPSGPVDWTVSTVDSAAISCGGRCDSASACVITPMIGGMPNTNPARSTCQPVDLAPCAATCSATQACLKQVCTAVVQPPNDGDMPLGTGLFAHLMTSPSGKLAVVYYDRTNGQAVLALEGSDGSLLPTVLDGMSDPGDFGQFASGAYAGDGTLHLVYGDAIAGTLLYRSLSPGGTPSATVETVDDGMRADGPHLVGASASVVANGTTIDVLYQDQSNADLMLATRSGAWSASDIRQTSEGSGFSSHLVSEGGKHYYSSWLIDRSMAPLGRLVLSNAP